MKGQRVTCGECKTDIAISKALVGQGFEPVCSEECRKKWNSQYDQRFNQNQINSMKCPRCQGYGKLVRQAPSGLERYTPYGFDKPFDCPDCNGTGQTQSK